MNVLTGQSWPVVSDTEMSEWEAVEEVERMGEDLSAARELIRVEVRCLSLSCDSD
jgi:hypothetical protein